MAREKICGIYQIKNEINGLIYIGSSRDIYNRWQHHRTSLRKNAHQNYYLQSDWNKYGEEAFSFTIIERCTVEEQFSKEQYYINTTRCWVRKIGYNIQKIVEVPPIYHGEKCAASKHTDDEIKEIIRLLLDPGLSLTDISNITGINRSTVSGIYYKNIWTHLSEGLDFPSRRIQLTKEDVIVIINRLLNGESDQSIADDYGVTEFSISQIRLHRSYCKLTEHINFPTHKLFGEKASSGKLKNEDVLEIIKLYNNGMTPTQLTEKYHVTKHTILDILHRKNWTSITNDLYIKPVEPVIKLSEDDVKAIIHELKHGADVKSLAKEYNVGITAIQKIKYNQTWKYINRDEID